MELNGYSPTPLKITQNEIKEIHEVFTEFDVSTCGYIESKDLKVALEHVGIKVAGFQIRQIMQEFDTDNKTHRNMLSIDEFERLCTSMKMEDVAKSFTLVVSKKKNLKTIGGLSRASSQGTTHTVRLEEQVAFSHWINQHLGRDHHLSHLLPIDPEGKALYDKVNDGILLCKIINHSCPDTIDERAINTTNLTLYRKHENLTLALRSAAAIGCNIVNIDGNDLIDGKPHLVLGLLWQIIQIGLFNQINLENCPGLAHLLQEGEKTEDLVRLPPEAILLRWVNYHLQQAGVNRVCTNFHSDISDSEIYTHLLYRIAPKEEGITMEALMEKNAFRRAEMMLQQAEKLGCRQFVTAQDVARGVYKLNLAFIANLFNNHPGLEKPDEVGVELALEETTEEKTYKNWINSLGVKPHVNWLYSDLTDGLVILQLYDIIKPGIVNWNRVHTKFSNLRKFIEVLENCNYAVELGKKMKFSLVGIAGNNISEGNPLLTLALIWQLMRAYTLSILTQLTGNGNAITEKEIVQWVNDKLTSAAKTTRIRSFQDPSIQDAKVVLDLIDSIKPGIIDYSVVKETSSPVDNLTNAKYAISMARRAGAQVYALPEHISEVKHKMVITVFACLMALSVQREAVSA